MGMFDWLFGKRKDETPPTSQTAQTTQQAGAVPFFAVIDVETTGLSPTQDRILELAVVRINSRGVVIDEWATRLDPEGPVGATHIHGISQADVAGKPVFRDVAPTLIPRIAGLPIAAHNARFDLAFLGAEFQRAGWDLPLLPAYCTMNGSREHLPSLDRRRLADCCRAAGVPLENAHSALGDARATAGLLSYYLARLGRGTHDSELHSLPPQAATVLWPQRPTREPSSNLGTTRAARPARTTPPRPKQPPLLQQITELSLQDAIDEGASEGSIVYLETLLDALEDGEISNDEARDFAELVRIYDLSDDDLAAAHRAFILALAHKAVDDGHISADERAELHTLAAALDVHSSTINELISHAEAARAARMSEGLKPLPADWRHGEPLRVGDKVVFTGCDDKQRASLERRAEQLGVRVMGNVSRLTAMLVTDGSMAGSKLAKAREVGTRIIDPDTFHTLLANLQPPAQATSARRAQPTSRATETAASPRSADLGSAPDVVGSPAAIRAWALANGHPVGVRGRISAEIVDAFHHAGGAVGATAGE